MKDEKPLTDKVYLLEKFEGKGGWTFARLPEIAPAPNTPFGWIRVQGTIDDYHFSGLRLMPMGNGTLFLPVKAGLRKSIGKQAGDQVRIVLYDDNPPDVLTEELRLCLLEEPGAYNAYMSSNSMEKKAMLEWIYTAKTDEEKVDRIARIMDKLSS